MSKNDFSIIGDILNEYSKDIQEGITQDAIKVAEEGKQELRATSPRGARKRYYKGWRVDKKSGYGYVHTTIHNATDWQLTHLLEKSHPIRNKYGEWGMSTPIEHIYPVEQKCIREYTKAVEETIKNGG